MSPWTCPTCARPFSHAEQWHSCQSRPVDAHFAGRDPRLRALFDAILECLLRVGPYRVEPVKGSIMLKRKATFVAMKVKKEALVVEFVAPTAVPSPRIKRTLQMTRTKVANTLELPADATLDPELEGWLAAAYQSQPPAPP